MIVMLLWAGSYKMTAPGAEGIVPLVSNGPLIWWHFKVFGPYIGSDIQHVPARFKSRSVCCGHSCNCFGRQSAIE
jgi:uncharacterized membrane protein YkgB